MSSMTRTALLLTLLIATPASSSAQTLVQPAQYRAAPASAAAIQSAIADWRRLRQGGNYSFGDYARFLNYNREWPAEAALRSRAESAMRPGEHAATVIAFFASKKPTSGRGHARLAEALSASGRHGEALQAAREAWASSDLNANDEMAMHSRFGTYFTTADHERRADALLFNKKPTEAQRFIGSMSAARRGAFAARIALQTRSPNAELLYQPLIQSVVRDAGLMMDRARYLREIGSERSAQQLFARQRNLAYRPADPDRFLDMMLTLARGAADAGDHGTAYNIARQVDDVLPAGTILADQAYGVRDKYTSLTWLGGVSAYSGLRRPGDAVAMFARYAQGGRSAQVGTKGLYWAGRAAMAARRGPEANNYFTRAAAYPELFYGQLALERLGRAVPAPNPLPTFAVTNAQRAEFNNRRLVQATRSMLFYGRADEQSLFVRALSESLDDDAERTLAIEFANQVRRQDLPVWVARSARNDGSAFYVRPAFPTLSSSPPTNVWSLAHAITRQESSFDRNATSPVGARGLMQLMPGTAREQAGKIGYGYDYGRLTSDPAYNVMLGSTYFARLLGTWDGNVPLAVASYNAGAGNVRKWVNRYGDPRRPGADVLSWIESIPFTETKGYVQRVIENSVVYDSMRRGSATPSTVHVSRYLGKSQPV